MKLYSYVTVCMIILSACQPAGSEFSKLIERQKEFDILIHGGTIIDGTGQAGYQADILISGDSIVYIGAVDTTQIETGSKIHATHKVISPGFIDTHAHGNPMRDAQFHNFLAMGVTTIALGQDGSSPRVEEMPYWMDTVSQRGAGVNIILFTGHGTIRQESGIGYQKDPDSTQITYMTALLQQALDLGCWGMSTGLEYTPGVYASDDELIALAKVVGSNNRMIMSHIRNEDDDQLNTSIRELMRQGEHCRVHVSHMKAVYGKGNVRAQQIISLLDSARQDGIQITADVYPYNASYTGIGIVFPSWALPPHDFARVVRNRRSELSEFLRNKVRQRNGPEATLLGTAPYAGKTLKEVAEEAGKPFEEVLIDDITPSGASAAYFVMDDELQSTLLSDSLTMVCSDGSPTMLHPRGYGSFAKIIEHYVHETARFELESAIYKMTHLPAKTLRIPDRGKLQKGMKADILVFDPQHIKATATFEAPHQLAQGFEYVIVNGKIAKTSDEFSEDLNGRLLYHPR